MCENKQFNILYLSTVGNNSADQRKTVFIAILMKNLENEAKATLDQI